MHTWGPMDTRGLMLASQAEDASCESRVLSAQNKPTDKAK